MQSGREAMCCIVSTTTIIDCVFIIVIVTTIDACLQMASMFMDSRMRGKRKLRLLEKAEWVYQPAPFSPLVHQLSKGGSDSLGAGMNGAVF